MEFKQRNLKIDTHVYLKVINLNNLKELQNTYRAKKGQYIPLSDLLDLATSYFIKGINKQILENGEDETLNRLLKAVQKNRGDLE